MVDDNSPDGTQDVVKQLQAVYGEDKCVECFPVWAMVVVDTGPWCRERGGSRGLDRPVRRPGVCISPSHTPAPPSERAQGRGMAWHDTARRVLCHAATTRPLPPDPPASRA